jgi:hemerythrin-like domain-containing protein
MTHPLASLIREHQVISRLVDGLAGYASALLRFDGVTADPRDLAAFARVFRQFADELHHDKEENILMPALARSGCSWDAGVLAAVRLEHEQERYLIDVLCQASERPRDWSAEDRRCIAAVALELAGFQKRHLARENSDLYPEVTRRLPAATLAGLAEAFARVDRAPRHVRSREALIALAEGLVFRYAALPGAVEQPAPADAAALHVA